MPTLSVPEAADFFGIASSNKMPDKFERSGYYAIGEKTGRAWHTGVPLMKKD